MAITSDEFRAALSRFASGVTVVTTKDNAGKLHGITVSAFCSVSLEPPLVLICIEKATGSHYAFLESGIFAVNILRDSQVDLSEHFAALADNKFDNIDFKTSNFGLPILPDTLANLECKLVKSYDGGDHTIFIGSVETLNVKEGDPLVHFLGEYHRIAD